MLKIDVLGLTQLSIIEEALKLAGKSHDYLFGTALTDEAAFQVLNDGKTVGIFQMDGFTCRYVLNAVTIDSFDDIVGVVAMARPGPAHEPWYQELD